MVRVVVGAVVEGVVDGVSVFVGRERVWRERLTCALGDLDVWVAGLKGCEWCCDGGGEEGGEEEEGGCWSLHGEWGLESRCLVGMGLGICGRVEC